MLRDRVVKGSAWVGIATVSGALLQFLMLAVLARFLTPYELGTVAAVLIVMTFGDLIATMGVSNAIIQRQDASQRELSSLYWLNAFTGVGVACAVALLGPSLGSFFRIPELGALTLVLAAVFLITPHSQVSFGVLQRELRFRETAISELCSAVVASAGGAVLAAYGFGPLGVTIAYVAARALRTIVLLWFARRDFLPSMHFRFSETLRFLRFGIVQSIDAIVSFIAANVGAIATGRIVSASALGGFNLANTYAVTTPQRLNGVITQVAFPALSTLQGDPARRTRASLATIELAGLVNAPLLLGMAATAHSFTAVVFGPDWEQLAPLLQVLALVGLARGLGNPMGVILMAANKMDAGLVINVVKSVVTIGLTIAGGMFGGMIGIAWALVIAGFLGIVLNIILLRVFLESPWWAAVKAHGAGILLALPMTLVAFLIDRLCTETGLNAVLSLTAAVLAGAVTYAITVFTTPNQLRETLGSLIGRRGSR